MLLRSLAKIHLKMLSNIFLRENIPSIKAPNLFVPGHLKFTELIKAAAPPPLNQTKIMKSFVVVLALVATVKADVTVSRASVKYNTTRLFMSKNLQSL